MTTDIVRIPFHGGDVLAVEVDGQPHIVLKPAFEAIGLDADQQVRKVQRQPWACTVVTTVQVGDQRRSMIAADVRTFLMALATIPASRVAEQVRPVLVAYQREVADVIEAHFMKRAAVRPDVADERLATALPELGQAAVARARILMLGTAVETGLLDRGWASSKTHLIAARTLGEEPDLPAELAPLYVPDFLKGKGLGGRGVTSVQSWFGRRAVEMGEANGLNVPALRPTEQPNGTIRETRAWRREHLPLFELVWDTHYAEKYDRPLALELGGTR